MATASTVYTVPEEFGGKSLSQLASSGYNLANPSVLAGYFGLDPNQTLKSGQALNLLAGKYAPDFRGAEFDALNRYFNPMEQADYQAQKAKAEQQAAVAPAIQTLQSAVDPLKERYAKLIADIKGRRETAVQQVGVDTAREFGKRGITTSSGVYDVALRNAQTPVEQTYGQLETGAAGEEQDRLMAIQNAIAGLQAGAGKDAITQALAMLQNQQGQSNWEKQFELSKQELDLKKARSAADPYGLFS